MFSCSNAELILTYVLIYAKTWDHVNYSLNSCSFMLVSGHVGKTDDHAMPE